MFHHLFYNYILCTPISEIGKDVNLCTVCVCVCVCGYSEHGKNSLFKPGFPFFPTVFLLSLDFPLIAETGAIAKMFRFCHQQLSDIIFALHSSYGKAHALDDL